MLDAARKALDVVAPLTVDSYKKDWRSRRLLERLVEIIGEAARRVPEKVQKDHPEIPWSKIIRQRHRLAHEYDDIDDALIWAVATRHIPDLVAALEALLPPDTEQRA
ncbi:MAG: DUF86 domain-containing protein [Phycisphaerales bacterium]|nr:DUF86 domain-containing protein [Phycisphaerales bacterium]